MLKKEGHPTSKIELRIIGGTWSVYPIKYKYWFLIKCFKGANNEKITKKDISEKDSLEKLKKELRKVKTKNEKTKNRIVGISVETRADYINLEEIKNLREQGVTMVELGVQSVFNDILDFSKTNLKVEDVISATKILKDTGFKIMYQMMLNLPKSNKERDFLTFKTIFENQNFKPDWLKIYPCVVLENTELYKLWKNKKYKSYSDKTLISLLKKIKTICPYWMRITRIYRDIPKEKIVSGCKISNLREIVKKEMEKENLRCKCIRCREVRERYKPNEKIYLFREDYLASNGKEIFLSFENKGRTKLFSFLRLRIPSFDIKKIYKIFPVLENSALIREIQTFGKSLDIGQKEKTSPQHKNLGKRLIKEAEKIAKNEFKLRKIAVISGIGVRDYYRKLGYRLNKTYMTKKIK